MKRVILYSSFPNRTIKGFLGSWISKEGRILKKSEEGGGGGIIIFMRLVWLFVWIISFTTIGLYTSIFLRLWWTIAKWLWQVVLICTVFVWMLVMIKSSMTDRDFLFPGAIFLFFHFTFPFPGQNLTLSLQAQRACF